MQLTANTTRRRCTRNPFALLRAVLSAAPAPSYSVLVAGRTVGSYATPEEAETALHRLTYPQQQRAAAEKRIAELEAAIRQQEKDAQKSFAVIDVARGCGISVHYFCGTGTTTAIDNLLK